MLEIPAHAYEHATVVRKRRVTGRSAATYSRREQMTSSSYKRAEVHRRCICHFSSTPSLRGGRARVDSLDLRLRRIRRTTGPDDRLCQSAGCDYRLAAPWPVLGTWSARWQQCRREGAGRKGAGCAVNLFVTQMTELLTQLAGGDDLRGSFGPAPGHV